MSTFNDLPAPHRAALQRLIEDSARWCDAAAAEELVHLARQRGRLVHVGRSKGGEGRPAWQVGSEFNYSEHLASETTLHTQAEAALFTVPYRFQQHLRLCLEANERIIYWAQRPRFGIHRIAGLGGRALREGLLVLTDQQCLWMVDPVTPTVALEGGFGYIARAVPVEWIADALVQENTDFVTLRLVSANRNGARSELQIEFPRASRDEVAQLERLLCAFTPRPGDSRLLRVSTPQPAKIELDDPMERDHARTIAVVEDLQAALRQQLNGETIFAQAFLPTLSDGGAKLLTITDSRIILNGARTRQAVVYELDALASAEICYSVLGSWFQVDFANAKPLRITIPITMFKGFNNCWRMLRKMSTRVDSRGPTQIK